MLGLEEYEQDYVDACPSGMESQIAMFHEVARGARDHSDADVPGPEGALESLEHEYGNNMPLVLSKAFFREIESRFARSHG